MKCPKCGYLGFDSVDRCRNCGYDFSLVAAMKMPELPLRVDQVDPDPLQDFALVDAARKPPARFGAEPAQLSAEPAPELPASVELPLFWSPAATPSRVPDRGDEEPLITRAAPPRPPLAVRRATPEVPRLRPNASRAPTLDLSFDEADTLPSIRIGAVPRPGLLVRPPARAALATAGLVSRLMAVAIDVALLAGIDLAVLYFTMKICGLEPQELSLLPVAPLVAFLLAQNGSYLVAFTAGGQTLGKMAAGIRVVGHHHAEPLDLGQAFRRSFWWMVLAAPAGLGFLTALSGRERRGLHDRLAGTRVVRVAAS